MCSESACCSLPLSLQPSTGGHGLPLAAPMGSVDARSCPGELLAHQRGSMRGDGQCDRGSWRRRDGLPSAVMAGWRGAGWLSWRDRLVTTSRGHDPLGWPAAASPQAELQAMLLQLRLAACSGADWITRPCAPSIGLNLPTLMRNIMMSSRIPRARRICCWSAASSCATDWFPHCSVPLHSPNVRASMLCAVAASITAWQ